MYHPTHPHKRLDWLKLNYQWVRADFVQKLSVYPQVLSLNPPLQYASMQNEFQAFDF